MGIILKFYICTILLLIICICVFIYWKFEKRNDYLSGQTRQQASLRPHLRRVQARHDAGLGGRGQCGGRPLDDVLREERAILQTGREVDGGAADDAGKPPQPNHHR